MEQSAASQAVPLAVPRGVTTSVWEVLLKASSTPEPGSFLELASGRIRAEVISRLGSGRFLLRLNHDQPLMDILNEEGVPPLPPYIKRRQAGADGRQTALDRESYQTVYAKVPGAIAAPTAGLHFTPDLLEALARRGIEHAAVTLHVGLGTFKPVTTATVEAHRMEPERYGISAETACRLRAARTGSGRIVAVGSTVVRVLETVMAEQGDLVPAEGRSRLFIHPPYNFRAVQALLTNFHLPASTLLMMVSAFAGRELIRHAYATAIRERYRFYSYGDCMLIL
jgi:S-adenosylmethionine:tRNA ribosyltransferase-isomerase